MQVCHTAAILLLATVSLRSVASRDATALAATDDQVLPAAVWEPCQPEQAGLRKDKLKELADLAGGRGCVVRHGYLVYTWGDEAKSGDIASAVKPIISTLLLLAVQSREAAERRCEGR